MYRAKYLSPTNDVAFKKVFSHPTILKHFLNTILRLPEEEKIVSLEYLSPEQVPKICQEKRSIVDIKVKDLQGKHYIVEMQNAYVEALLSRLEFYGSSAITSQLKPGSSYDEISPVVLICIMNNTNLCKDLDVVSFHKVMEVKTKKVFFKNLSYVLVNLDLFKKEKEEELESLEDQWLYYMKYVEKSQKCPKNLTEEEIKRAYDAIAQANWDQEEFDEYIKTKLAIDSEVLGKIAKFNEGVRKGLAEGRKKGIEEGENKRNEEIIKNMLIRKSSIEEISEILSIKIDTLKEIINKINKN